MNLPSLPTDRLYKVQAFGGLSLILACAYWIHVEGTALQRRRANHVEQTRLLVSEYNFLVEERKQAAASLTRFARVGDSLNARERELRRRSAAIDAQEATTNSQSEDAVWNGRVALFLATLGAALASNGFTTWRRVERALLEREIGPEPSRVAAAPTPPPAQETTSSPGP